MTSAIRVGRDVVWSCTGRTNAGAGPWLTYDDGGARIKSMAGRGGEVGTAGGVLGDGGVSSAAAAAAAAARPRRRRRMSIPACATGAGAGGRWVMCIHHLGGFVGRRRQQAT